MKRKIIKQGVGGHTIFLPIKWVRKQGLKPGDEIDVSEHGNSLFIKAEEFDSPKQRIDLEITESRESAIRTILVNAYRSGYDLVNIHYKGSQKKISTIVQQFMLGFDISKTANGRYVIESIAEPSYDNFNSLLARQFFLLKEILENLFETDCSDFVHKIQRYDNFLKRSIIKQQFSIQAQGFLWQLLSNLTQIARAALHFQKEYNSHTKIIHNKKLIESHTMMLEMFSYLHKAFLKCESSKLYKMHELEEKLMHSNGPILCSKLPGKLEYQFLALIRVMYLCSSPLTGYLFIKSLDSK